LIFCGGISGTSRFYWDDDDINGATFAPVGLLADFVSSKLAACSGNQKARHRSKGALRVPRSA